MLIKEGRTGVQSCVLCQILNVPRAELGEILDPAGQEGLAVPGPCPGVWLPPLGLGFWERELKM